MNFNWNWLKPTLSNAPLALIALPAAYGSAMFEARVYEMPWNIGIGIGVEAAYTGVIFFASRKSRQAFFLTVLTAMLVGVIYNSLHAADRYGLLNHLDWGWNWLLSLVHGAPLSALAFAYAMLMHYTSDAKPEGVKAGVKEDETEITPTAQVAPLIAHHYAPPSADSGGDAIEDAIPVQPEPVSVQAVLDAVQEDAIDPREVAKQLRTNGGSWDEIATALGKSKRTVQLWVNGR